MTVKEFRQVMRDRTTIIIAVMIPMLQLAIFGYAIRTDVTNVSMVIVDLSQSELSREFVNAVGTSGVFNIRGYCLSHGQAHDLIRNGKAKVAIVIPPDFAEVGMVSEPRKIQILLDGSDSTVASYVQSAINGISTSFGEKLFKVEATKPILVPVSRILFNPELESATFFVPALAVLILHMPLIVLTSLAIVRERVEGTLEQLIVTPIGRLGLMLGKLGPYFAIGVAAGVLVILVMVLVFKIAIRGNVLLLCAFLLLWIMTSLAIGLMLSSIAKTELQAVLTSILVVVPSILLSGFMFPRESMPSAVYPITLLLPMTYAVNIVRAIVIRGADVSAILGNLLVLFVFFLGLITIATKRFQKRLG